jgi:hypothetical protein
MAIIDELLSKAAAESAAMSPQERAAMYDEQRQSFARAEAGFGSDADQAAFSAAVAAGDAQEIARLNRESGARVAALEAMWRARNKK